MAFSREFIFPEREREIQEERGIQEREEKLRGWGEVCPGYLPSAFRHPPMVVLTN